MIVDFHCHSNCSDGQLSPYQLIELAQSNDITMLSITDHDSIDAYKCDFNTSIKLITGIEFSTVWNKIGVHVVGLNIDVDSDTLKGAVEQQKLMRYHRAEIISKRLMKCGLSNALTEIVKVKGKDCIGRPDFAKLLVQRGICKDMNHAFKKYLGAGKIGDVKSQWLDLAKIVEVIKAAGGIAVMAHPLYYKLTNSKLRRLLSDFKKLGGEGLEVINGYQNLDKTTYLSKLCREFNFKASIGSDFHSPNQWKKLGCNSLVVDKLPPVWENF